MSVSPSDPRTVEAMASDPCVQRLSGELFAKTFEYRYSYNFTWLGRPIIQYPTDIMAMQEIFWRVRPELIIETGIAHGGSLIFSASILEMIGGSGRVLGIDVDIREHNRREIDAHPMRKRIDMIQGSSIDPQIVGRVKEAARGKSPVLVILDSNHTHEHVRAELDAYADLVSEGSYLIVLDTVVEHLPKSMFPDRPWGPGDNPKTAVDDFLSQTPDFEIDRPTEAKLLLTVAPSGYLRRKSKSAQAN
jgi:cephalosporin hydroxylase